MLFEIWDSYPFEQRIMAEVNDQTELKSGRFQIICYLRSMLWRNLRNRLNFNDDFARANKIRPVSLLEAHSVIGQNQWLLRFKGNFTFYKFYLQTFLVNRLQKSVAHNFVDLHTGASNLITFSIVNQGIAHNL